MSFCSEEINNEINYIGFNQDSKVIAVGHKRGYMFYKTSDILENSTLSHEGESLPRPVETDDPTSRNTNSLPCLGLSNLLIVERLFSSSLIVVVAEKDPRVLRLYNFTERNIIVDHRMSKSILAVKLNEQRIVICLESTIHIYSLKDVKVLHTIMETPSNKLGLIDMTTKSGTALIAYPGNAGVGSVNLFDAITLLHVNTFVAHEGCLACVKFNQEGTMLATASTRGTVIRVFSVPSGNNLFEFRRGVSRCVTIFSLCFSADSKFLASSSNTETVHVFKLDSAVKNAQETEASSESTSWFDSINKTIAAYMPTQMLPFSGYMTPERSFATAKLPGSSRSNQVSLITHEKQQFVMVATSDGFVYTYRLIPEGGELDLIKQHRIGPDGDSSSGSGTATEISELANDIDNMACSDPVPEDLTDDCPPMSHASY